MAFYKVHVYALIVCTTLPGSLHLTVQPIWNGLCGIRLILSLYWLGHVQIRLMRYMCKWASLLFVFGAHLSDRYSVVTRYGVPKQNEILYQCFWEWYVRINLFCNICCKEILVKNKWLLIPRVVCLNTPDLLCLCRLCLYDLCVSSRLWQATMAAVVDQMSALYV